MYGWMSRKEGCSLEEPLRQAYRALELVISLREGRGGKRTAGAVVELDPKADAQVRAAAERAKEALDGFASCGCEPL